MRFHPSYLLSGASPLPLDVGYLFLVGANILLSLVVKQQVVILEFSQEKMSACPSTLPSCLVPEVHDIVQEAVIKTIPKKKAKKQNG